MILEIKKSIVANKAVKILRNNGIVKQIQGGKSAVKGVPFIKQIGYTLYVSPRTGKTYLTFTSAPPGWFEKAKKLLAKNNIKFDVLSDDIIIEHKLRKLIRELIFEYTHSIEDKKIENQLKRDIDECLGKYTINLELAR